MPVHRERRPHERARPSPSEESRGALSGGQFPTAHALLSNPFMIGRKGAAALATTIFLSALLVAGCTGGQEGKAAEEQQPRKNPITGTEAASGKPGACCAVSPVRLLLRSSSSQYT